MKKINIGSILVLVYAFFVVWSWIDTYQCVHNVGRGFCGLLSTALGFPLIFITTIFTYLLTMITRWDPGYYTTNIIDTVLAQLLTAFIIYFIFSKVQKAFSKNPTLTQ